jgi:hypothetical protein
MKALRIDKCVSERINETRALEAFFNRNVIRNYNTFCCRFFGVVDSRNRFQSQIYNEYRL